MTELIFLFPTIFCVIVVGATAWNRRKQKKETDHEWVNRVLE